MSRLTKRAECDGVKAVRFGNRDNFLEGEFGYTEADKLAHYEDLEEQLEKIFGGKLTIDEVINNLYRVVQNGEDRLDYARILTNAEAAKWDKWKDLEEEGRLIELPCKVGDTVWLVEKNFPQYPPIKFKFSRKSDIVREMEKGMIFEKTKEEAEAKLEELKGE